MRSTDDRTTASRIRDAAITEFAANGVAATSVRTIATAAGVSPGLVIHHFGSKENLRNACDVHVAATIRETKTQAMAAGAGFDPLASLHSTAEGPPAGKYLARALVDGSAHVAELVDEMVNDAIGYINTGVETGMIRPSEHPRERAAILTIWMLGGLVLHEHLERLIGVNITADFSQDPEAMSSYVVPAVDILGGFITESYKELISEAFAHSSESEETKDTA